ncbi:hypothetical protein HYQ44_018899 [Verticillium longisporum]|nr:hypothetical protein HYQ44_018899 [Verticillium longisporum]
MVSDSSSNIRVFIRWDDQIVFAGEEIKCTITFKNICHPAASWEAHHRLDPTDLVNCRSLSRPPFYPFPKCTGRLLKEPFGLDRVATTPTASSQI